MSKILATGARAALSGASSNATITKAARPAMVAATKITTQRRNHSACCGPNLRSYATVSDVNSAQQQNLSFVLEKQGKVKFEDRPIPKLTSPYDVLVNVRWTGICGSDVHYWQHGAIGDFVVRAPMVLGHESSGTVTEVGDKVTSVKVGDRVAMEPGIPCRRCPRCKEGMYNLCVDMRFAATPPIDGTLAKYYVLPEDFAYKLPENMSFEEGALMEPLSVGVHINKQAGTKNGSTVVIFGAGPVGLLCGSVAKAYGANKIVIVDINQERLDFAKKYAATHTIVSKKQSAAETAAQIIKECEIVEGADIVMDATGAEPCIQAGIHVLRAGGTYVQGGMGKPDIMFPIGAAGAKELNIKGSFRYNAHDYETAIGLVTSGRVNVKELVSKKVKFTDAEEAFEDVAASRGIKILIEGVPDQRASASA
ncbi:hypothetical protein LTR86_007174 [Recurvomyces mirabilis]|nr:hypothetical protein LTR86_007174 [Recurvomyces mirabilis]